MIIRGIPVGLLALALTIPTPSARAADAWEVADAITIGAKRAMKVADFPDAYPFQFKDGRYLDAGYRYKQVRVVFTPLWNYGGEWCAYYGNGRHCFDMEKGQLDELASAAGVKLPETPSLPFWDAYGGKLTLLVFFLVGWWFKKLDTAPTIK